MARRRSTIEVLPSARRLIGSLRDIGYETPEAVADLIDNSIAAGATTVDIKLEFDGARSWLRIADDGVGMNGTTITGAMKYGSDRDYADDDLGKFGLGLKTASMSQCRRLSVASRTSKTTARIEARQLDLDYVERTDAWRVLILGAEERAAALVDPLKRHQGTVVLWEDLDRVLNYKNPGSEWARNKLLGLAERLDLHLGMVFHRFLSGQVPRRKKLTITINGTKIEPWDPFATDEKYTEALKPQDFEIHTPNGSGVVRLEPYVLPPRDHFSSEAAHRRASGPNNWNRQQGFYIYRVNRLIQSGGWSRMRTQDEHTKLARVGMFFTPELDHAFGINVAKMRVNLPPELKDEIKDLVDRTAKKADRIYRQKPEGGAKTSGKHSGRAGAGYGSGNGVGGGTNRNGSGHGTGGGIAVATTAQVRRRALEAAADAVAERSALDKIVKALSDSDPDIAHELGW